MSHNLPGLSAPLTNSNIAQVVGEHLLLQQDVDTFLSPIGGETPVFPDVAGEVLYLSSSDAAEAGVMRIRGLDSEFNEQTEDVALSGTTPVATVATFSRINRLEWTEPSKTLGDISVKNLAGDKEYRRYLEESQTSVDLVYTVPKGRKWQAIQMYAAVTRDSNSQSVGTVYLYFGLPGKYFSRLFKFPVANRGSSNVDYVNQLPEESIGPVDLYATASTSDVQAEVFARLSLKVLT